ncbi:MAG: CBS domain-containing protein [Pseudomonadota bacterium]
MAITARELMSTQLITVRPETSVRELAELLVIHKISGLPVLDEEGSLVGIVSQSDLVALNKLPHVPNSVTLFDWVIYLEGMGRLKAEMAKIGGNKVADIMTRAVITVPPEESLEKIATIMAEKNVHTIPVVDGGRLLGLIGKLDIVRSLLK